MLICQEMFLLLTKDNGKKEDWVHPVFLLTVVFGQ